MRMVTVNCKKGAHSLTKRYYCEEYNIHMVVMQQLNIVVDTWNWVSTPVIRVIIHEDGNS